MRSEASHFANVMQEICEESGIPMSELRLGRDNLERALMARLMEVDVSNEWPLHYLMASYNRLSDELRSLTGFTSQAELDGVSGTLVYGKQLTVSYSGLLLSMDMFPQVLGSLLSSCNSVRVSTVRSLRAFNIVHRHPAWREDPE